VKCAWIPDLAYRQVRYRITDLTRRAASFGTQFGESISLAHSGRPRRRASIEVLSAFHYAGWSMQSNSPAESIPFCGEE